MSGLGKGLTVKRCLTFATGLVECLCFAGAVFGWASLVFVLKTEGYFSSLCVNTTGVNATQVLDCSGQDEQFSLVFTIASFMNNFLTLPNGFLFDRFGTTVARLLGTCLYTLGSLMLAFSTAAFSNLLFPAISLLAVGGILLLMTNMQVANLFGARRSTIITLYNGAFDSSSALFLVIKLLYEAGVSLLASFLFLCACSVFHLLRTFFLLPRKHIPYPLPDEYTYEITCGKSKTLSLEQTKDNGNAQKTREETLQNTDDPVKQVEAQREEEETQPEEVAAGPSEATTGDASPTAYPSIWKEEQYEQFKLKNEWMYAHNGKLGCTPCHDVKDRCHGTPWC